MRFQLFLAAWALFAVLVVGYLGYGSLADVGRFIIARRRRRTLSMLSVLLFESDREASAAYDAAGRVPRRVLLDVIQTLAVDLSGQANDRLRELTRVSGLQQFIVKRSRSRRWRMRIQAAQLQYLVVDPNFDRAALLADPHPLVRARAVESLDDTQGEEFLDLLLALLADSSVAVRLAAQQKILDVGTPAVPALQHHMRHCDQRLIEVLELAANLADPRLVETLDEHASAPDASMREMTAVALGNGVARLVAPILLRLMNDDSPAVRAAAVVSLGAVGDLASVTEIGRHLSDRSWAVRRACGVSLDRMGSAGRMVLRQHLSDPDPFARDMARQVLDSAAQRGLPGPSPLIDPLHEIDESELADSIGTPSSFARGVFAVADGLAS